jgi:DNA-binding LacI/PurR family transcriptional regulator
MKQMAKRLGITEAAVSYALTNRGRLSIETRRRVLSLAKDLNYHPHSIARSLAMKKAHAVGVGLYDFDYITMYYFSSIISGIGHQASIRGYDLRFVTTNKEIQKHNLRSYFLTRVEERSMDGIIIVDHAVSDEDILMLKAKDIPMVLVDRDIESEQMNCVLIDQEGGAFKATEYLVAHGHDRIAIILGPLNFHHHQRELKGYMMALEKYRLEYDEGLLISRVEYDVEQFPEVASALNRKRPPTAFVVHSGLWAMSVMRKLAEMGLNVPEDVAVVGLEDSPLTNSSYPRLTTVRTELQQVGESAADILFKLVDGEEPEKRKVTIKTELIVRESS